MQSLIDAVQSATGTERHDDDIVDRLNHRYTLAIILLCAALVSFRYAGSPITCWEPKHFTGSHIKYTHSFCWVNNTYYVPFAEKLPLGSGEPRHVIPYYQWIPIILLMQAVFFYLPSFVWNGLNQKSGVDADDILKSAHLQSVNPELIITQFDRFLTGPRSDRKGKDCTVSCKDLISNTVCRCCAHYGGNYLVLLYLVTKLLYILNIVAQLFIVLNAVLQTNFTDLGVTALKGLYTTLEEEEHIIGNAGAFPKVTLCDMRVRRLGNIQQYTLQCLLPINLFAEKVYIFLWFWMVFVLILTSWNFLVWLSRFIYRSDRITFVKNHLRFGKRLRDDNDPRVKTFVTGYLKQDGVFLLRLIGHNYNGLTVTSMTVGLWDNWLEKEGKGKENPDKLSIIEEGEGEEEAKVAPQ